MVNNIHLLTVFSVINLFSNSITYAMDWANPSHDYTNEMYTIYNPGHYNTEENNVIHVNNNINALNAQDKPTNNNINILSAPSDIMNHKITQPNTQNNIINHNIDILNNKTNTNINIDQSELDQFINDFLTGKITPTKEYNIPAKNINNNNILNNRKFSYDVSNNKLNNLNTPVKYTIKPAQRAVTADANNRNNNHVNTIKEIKPIVTKVIRVAPQNRDIIQQILNSNASPEGKLTVKNNELTVNDDNDQFNPQFSRTYTNFPKFNKNKKNNIQMQIPINIPKLNINTDYIQLNTHDPLDSVNTNIRMQSKKGLTKIYSNKCITDRGINKDKINVGRKLSGGRNLSKSPIKIINRNTIAKKINDNNIKLEPINNVINPNFNTGIITNWEGGITPEEVNIFLNNINKSSMAYDNMKIQTYSLLADVAPAFGDPDNIRLLFEVMDNNKENKNKLHIYSYEKPLAITGTFIDYYLNNVWLYNTDRNSFNSNRLEYVKKSLSFDDNEYLQAIKILSLNNFYEVINKLVKGINTLECFNERRKQNNLVYTPLNISHDNKLDWFVSTFELFDYALQYSNKDDKLMNTTFAKFDNYLKLQSQHRNINEEILILPTLKSFVQNEENKQKNNKEYKNVFEEKKIKSALESLYREEDKNIGCCGIMGSILMFRIFPELQTIFSSNQFYIHDSIIDRANMFYFSTDQSLAQQFNAKAHNLLDIMKFDNGRKLFSNTDYLIMITNGLTRDKVINDRKYISRYEQVDSKNNNWKLELYELMGVQLCAEHDTDYLSIDKSKLEDTLNTQSILGKECINKKLKPMQALYKRISQKDYDRYMSKVIKLKI